MHWAFIGDFKQACTLLLGERAFKRDDAFESVAGNAIDIYLFVAERNADIGQGKTLALGVHAQRHRCAGTQPGHHEIERGRAGIGTADADRLIGDQLMLADGHCLLVSSFSIFCNNHT